MLFVSRRWMQKKGMNVKKFLRLKDESFEEKKKLLLEVVESELRGFLTWSWESGDFSSSYNRI